jgi:hypothetical protein
MIAPLFKKNTLEQTGFAVSDHGFSYKGRAYKLADVVEHVAIESSIRRDTMGGLVQ